MTSSVATPPIPTMTWAQLSDMQARGFTIGSHAVNHIDCVAEPKAVVVSELCESRDQLRERLGIADPVFAYPYGGKARMNAEGL